MDMYVRMYDELRKSKDDNPTIGIVLCSETEKELRAEIETQKEIYEMQQDDFSDECKV